MLFNKKQPEPADGPSVSLQIEGQDQAVKMAFKKGTKLPAKKNEITDNAKKEIKKAQKDKILSEKDDIQFISHNDYCFLIEPKFYLEICIFLEFC